MNCSHSTWRATPVVSASPCDDPVSNSMLAGRHPIRPIHLLKLKRIANHGEPAAEITLLPQVLAQGQRQPHQPADRRAFDDYRFTAGAGGAGFCNRCVSARDLRAKDGSSRRLQITPAHDWQPAQSLPRRQLFRPRYPRLACGRESTLNAFRHEPQFRPVVDVGGPRWLRQAATAACSSWYINAPREAASPPTSGGQAMPATEVSAAPSAAGSGFNCTT